VSGIEILRAEDYEALSRLGAETIAAVVRETPRARVLVATGKTPMGVYRELAAMARSGELDASGIMPFQLDEYLGLAPGDHRAFARWALESFVVPLGLAEESLVRLPVADGSDPDLDLREYDRRVREEGGYDLAILGIGENGHLGFNEPPCDWSAPTRRVELSRETIASNARYWGDSDDVPRRAVTVGMEPLLGARTVLLLASGARKRDIVRRALSGPVTPEVPASYLQRAARVVAIVDREAWPGSIEPDGGPS
jgi:glucosamine-6-phosphate deaminase